MRLALYLCLGLMGIIAFGAPAYTLILHLLDLIAAQGNISLIDVLRHTCENLLRAKSGIELLYFILGPLCFLISFLWAGIIFLVPLAAKLKLVLLIVFVMVLVALVTHEESANVSVLIGALLGFCAMACLVLGQRVRLIGQLQRLLHAYYQPELDLLERPKHALLSNRLHQEDIVPEAERELLGDINAQAQDMAAATPELSNSMRLAALHALNSSDLSLKRNRALLALKRHCWRAIARPLCCNLWGYTIALTDLPYLVRALNLATQGNLTVLRRMYELTCAYEEAAHANRLTPKMKRFARNHLTGDCALALKTNLRVVCEQLLDIIPTKLELFAAERNGKVEVLDEECRSFSTESVMEAWRYDQDLSHYMDAHTPSPLLYHKRKHKSQLTPRQQHAQALRIALYHELTLQLTAGHGDNPPNALPPSRQRLTDLELLQVTFYVTPQFPQDKATATGQPAGQPTSEEQAAAEALGMPNAMLTVEPMGRMRLLGQLRLLTPILDLCLILLVMWGLLQDPTLRALLDFQAHHYVMLFAEALNSTVPEVLNHYGSAQNPFITHHAFIGLSNELSHLPLTVYGSALLSGYNLWLLCLLLTLIVGSALLLSGIVGSGRVLLKQARAGLEYWHSLSLLQIYLVCTFVFGVIAVGMTYQSKLGQLWYDINSDLEVLAQAMTPSFELKPQQEGLITINGIISRHADEHSLGPNLEVKTLRRMGLYSPDTGHRWINVYAPLHSSYVAEILSDIRQEQDRRFVSHDAPFTKQRAHKEINASVTPYRLTFTPNLHLVVSLQPIVAD